MRYATLVDYWNFRKENGTRPHTYRTAVRFPLIDTQTRSLIIQDDKFTEKFTQEKMRGVYKNRYSRIEQIAASSLTKIAPTKKS